MRLGVGSVLPVDGVSFSSSYSIVVTPTPHAPHEQVLVRLEGISCRGCGVEGQGGYSDVSDVACIEGSGGTYCAGIPLHGSPSIPLTLPVPFYDLTSCFDREEGFRQPSSDIGSLTVAHPYKLHVI
jgi:hypothetical protein